MNNMSCCVCDMKSDLFPLRWVTQYKENSNHWNLTPQMKKNEKMCRIKYSAKQD